MALPDAPHPGRRDRKAKLSHLVGDTDLAEGRLLQGKCDNLCLDLRRDPVRQDRLLAGDFLQRQLATFVIELLKPVKAIARVAEHFAGLADVTKLPGKLQQTNLGFDDLLFLGHDRCPSQDAEAGRSVTLTTPRPASAHASAL
jgi:hypothetical protein